METLFELVVNVIVAIFDVLNVLVTLSDLGFDLNPPDTPTARILLGAIIICLGGVIWFELHSL